MNKFLVLALVALSCSMVAANPLMGDELESSAINPSDDEETSRLDDQTRVFSDFCLRTRGMVFGDIKTMSNGFSSKVFNTLFNTADFIGNDALTLLRAATAAVAEQIRHPETPVNDDGSEIASIRKAVQEEQTVPNTLLTGFFNVIKVTAGSVSNNVITKFNGFKSLLGSEGLVNFLKESCGKVAGYESLMKEEFNKFKNELGEAAGNVRMEDVQCVTSRRVMRLDGFCKLSLAAKDPLMKAAVLKPIPTAA